MKYLKKFNENLSYDSVETDDVDTVEYIINQIEEATKTKVVEVSGKYKDEDIDLGLTLDNGDKISINYEFAPYSGYSSITGRMMGVIEVEYKTKDKTIRKNDNDVDVEAGREIYGLLKEILNDLGDDEELDYWPYHIVLPPDFENRYDVDNETYGYTNITIGFESEEQAQKWIQSLKVNKYK